MKGDGLARTILNALRRQGWRFERRRRHFRFVPPDPAKPAVVQSATPHGGRRALQNWIADLRRSGFVWPEAL